MNDRKERVYSEEDLCEYTILQKIDELERQLQNLKSETGLYETKVDANNSHSTLSDNISSIDNNLHLFIESTNNAFNNIDKLTPTDVGIKNNKLGLQNGSTWLVNRNAINLEGFVYNEDTNTLKPEGGGSLTFPYIINDKSITLFKVDKYNTSVTIVEGSNKSPLVYKEFDIPKDMNSNSMLWAHVLYLGTGYRKTAIGLGTDGGHSWDVLLTTENEGAKGTYFLPYINNEKVKLLCNKDINIHNISLSYMGQSYLYFTLITSSNTAISSMIELNALLDTPNRHISCSGTLYLNQTFYPISCLYWQGSLSKSYILYTNATNGEVSITMTNAFGTQNTIVTDVVKPI